MSTLADLQAEVAALRTEVARLREDAALFFTVHRDDDGAVLDTQLHCWMLHCEAVNLRARASQQSRGMIGIEDDGPYLALWGEDQRAHAILRVTGNQGELQLLGADHEPVVHLLEREGHGHAVVLSPGGIPRAVMKGAATGGHLSALDPDGKVCAVVCSTDQHGSIAVLDQEEVRAEMTAASSSGTLLTYDAQGEQGAIMSSNSAGNSFLLADPKGEIAISIASTPSGNALSVGRLSSETAKGTILISDLPELGGSIILHDQDGRPLLDLTTDPEGGVLRVLSPDPAAHLHLHIQGGGGALSAAHSSGDSLASLAAPESGGFVTARATNDRAAILNAMPDGASFSIRHGDRTPFFVGADESPNSILVLGNDQNEHVVQLLSRPEGGAIVVSGGDGVGQASMVASSDGGQMNLLNEVGIERVALRSVNDGGGLHLKWGGTTGLLACATARGGLLTTHGPDGRIVESLPNEETFGELGEEEG